MTIKLIISIPEEELTKFLKKDNSTRKQFKDAVRESFITEFSDEVLPIPKATATLEISE